MSVSDVKKGNHLEEHNNENSLRGTLFSSIVFVGGGIAFFIVLLFYFYMTRL